ncbi:hypothetical protein EDB12_4232 [Vibrio crassostreae]|nr:hypothetical protein EDB12_4232 [Vibrio crassostreae]
MILDCSSYESAKKSLCEIFHVTEEALLAALDSVENDRKIDYYTLEKNVDSYIRQQFGEPDDDMEVLWFHGTRVEDESLFYSHGILTKSKVRDTLYSRLISLSSGLEKKGKNPFCESIAGKGFVNDEGPFAFLIRCVAIESPGSNHSYTHTPEMVEDIAGSLLGENYEQLVQRFRDITNPFIVSFTAKPKGGEVSRALFFLKLIEDGESELESGSSANTFFNSYGTPINVDRIRNIEPL